jgi:hypothetical protein
MSSTTFTPEESVLLIAKTIRETKSRFVQSGHIYILWGTLMFAVSLCQYFLVRRELYNYAGYPCLLYPLAGVYTWIYNRKKYRNKPKTMLGNILMTLGLLLGFNLMILGFLFFRQLGDTLVPVFLIFLAVFNVITGVAIKHSPMIIGGILINIIGLGLFYIDWQYHSLFMAIAVLIAFVIPGILLNRNQGKNDVQGS